MARVSILFINVISTWDLSLNRVNKYIEAISKSVMIRPYAKPDPYGTFREDRIVDEQS